MPELPIEKVYPVTTIWGKRSAGEPRQFPVKPVGMLAAIAVLGIVIFLSSPSTRLWIAGIVVVMALLQRGGDAARIIEGLRKTVYGG